MSYKFYLVQYYDKILLGDKMSEPINDIKLFKYDDNLKEESEKIRYLFHKNIGISYEGYLLRCKLKNIIPIEQGDLSDFEYFFITHPFEKRKEKEYFYLLVNNNPVTCLKTKEDENGIIEINLETAEQYMRNGYATTAVSLVEQFLFQNPNVRGLKMVDVSDFKQTSKIAIKLGYLYVSEEDFFFKENPNFKLETAGIKKD